MVYVVIILVIALIAGFLAKSYNKFIVLKNRVLDQKSQIDVQLKRRYDLIPNLVQTAKGYANFEKSTLEAVTNARAKAVNASNLNEEIKTNNELSGVLRNFFAVSESYPELKANQNFLHLQSEFSTTEDKIAKSRQFFNDTVMKYNTAIEMFPSNLIASIFGFKHFEYLSATEAESQAVRLDENTFGF